MKLKHFITIVFCLLTSSSYSQMVDYNIRGAVEDDFQAIQDLALRTFAHTYHATTKEEIEKLKNFCNAIIVEEMDQFHNNREKMIFLVVVSGNKIIGFISANLTNNPQEIYGRCFAIDPSFQSQGIGKELLKRCRKLLPTFKKAVCMTNKKNSNAQKLYDYLGGKRVENPAWTQYLYKHVNPADYFCYEFNEEALMAFDTH